ncbi:MAG TPA: hypothetical protein VFT35_15355 [Gaiellaceae bacterium]|nr:hypothetical protein [Gaiellaceae bacterium]
MLRRVTVIGLFAIVLGVFAQTASADPVNAKNAGFFTAACGSTQLQVVVNGNGVFTPAHVIGSTSVFVPTAFDLTFTFIPSGGGAAEVDTETSARHASLQTASRVSSLVRSTQSPSRTAPSRSTER